jgi:hypothetical protein
LVSSSNDLFRVPEKVTPEDAATISIGPVVALSLLNNFVKLSPGKNEPFFFLLSSLPASIFLLPLCPHLVLLLDD